MAITNFQLSVQSAIWIDANSQYTVNNLPDRLPDDLAIKNSLINILTCPVGARGKIFQPEYGSEWQFYLQEPIDDITSGKLFIALIQAIARWEPRIVIDYSKTFVKADTSIPGYNVQLSATDTITKKPIMAQFTEQL